ncbi:SIMPL domain-containing protein [Halioxenophilus aromaticivorans]|uniref:SIMPL domain-containing protein n=1 Tax=Halioxenophilus aromaticivorans TaxID=1306992 RepID=A0AAV3TX34_9ALTE
MNRATKPFAKRHLWVAAMMAVVPAWAVAQTELKGSPEELRNFLHPTENIVTLTAEAEEVAYSDQAIVSLVVKTEDDELAVAIEKNSQLRSQIHTALLDAAIENKHINNSKFSSSPQYGWFGKQPDSYEVVNRVAITLSQEEQLKTVASLVDKFPEVSLASTEFSHTKKDDSLAKVKEQALSKIMMQKMLYEDSLNVTLVPVNFRDQRVHYAATRGAIALEEAVVSSVMSKAATREADGYAGSAPAATSFDETKYTANIAVDFKVQPKQ